MRILVADDDPTFRRMVLEILRTRTAHTVIDAEDGARALQIALSEPRPELLLLDWLMPKMNGTVVCRHVRAKDLKPQPHILFLTARRRREEVLECLAAGADDLLTKPFAPDVLVARVELALARRATSADATVLRALVKAQQEPSGELVIRSGETCARVLFQAGKVAWAHHIDGSGSLFDEIAPESGIDPDMARAVVEECRKSGAGLTDTLVAWGLIDRARMREAMRGWISKKLDAICSLPDPQVLFLPQRLRASPELLFDLHEVSSHAEEALSLEANHDLDREDRYPSPSLIPAREWSNAFLKEETPTAATEELLARCMAAEGVLGVALIERESGLCVGRRGQELVADVAWGQLQALNSLLQHEDVEDSMVITAQHLHLVMLLPGEGTLLVYALFDARETRVAVARLGLRRAVGE